MAMGLTAVLQRITKPSRCPLEGALSFTSFATVFHSALPGLGRWFYFLVIYGVFGPTAVWYLLFSYGLGTNYWVVSGYGTSFSGPLIILTYLGYAFWLWASKKCNSVDVEASETLALNADAEEPSSPQWNYLPYDLYNSVFDPNEEVQPDAITHKAWVRQRGKTRLVSTAEQQSLNRGPIKQFLCVLTYWMVWFCVYMCLQLVVKHIEFGGEDWWIWYVAFACLNFFLKTLFKTVGLVVDLGKRGTCSHYYLAEVIMLLFYYTFYRALFEKINTWWTFLVLKGLHLLYEWMAYPLRATRTYFSVVNSAPEGPLRNVMQFFFLRRGVNLRDWQCFLALDYILRICVMLHSLICYLLYMAFLRYSYNSKHYPHFAELPDEEYTRLVYYYGVSALLELLNAALMHYCFWRKKRLSLIWRAAHLFQNLSFYIAVVAICGGVFADVYIAYTAPDFEE
eukprot:TRINITY_DN18818_c0_g1_i1.p1 TRINITY_DN18818_c0_g1~~TRINITY_DN18818_c0_g1_i1.p1  ORF type:complete len:452 (+),score=54.61 TRINITY_DN18818_c0_g1_i1:193-1548(+)